MDILLQRLSARLQAQNLKLEVTDKAKKYIAENGSDNVYGARPLKRYLQSHVETPIAKFIIESNPKAETTVTVDVNDEGLYIRS